VTGPVFAPGKIIAVLNAHRVEYVVVGGFAAQVYGARRPTRDIDVVPRTTRENLARLVAALRELHAGIRGDDLPDGLPFDTDPAALNGQKMLNLRTPFGDVDLTFTPAAFPGGYDDLAPRAHAFAVGDVVMHFADLADVIASKEAAGRPKDTVALPELYRLQAQARPGISRPEL
jgi:hypothetical protein